MPPRDDPDQYHSVSCILIMHFSTGGADGAGFDLRKTEVGAALRASHNYDGEASWAYVIFAVRIIVLFKLHSSPLA